MCAVKNRFCISSHVICKQNFLPQAQHKKRNTLRNQQWIATSNRNKLWHHFPMMYDGASDKMREKGDKQTVIDKRVMCAIPNMAVYKIGNLIEGEKRNGQR